jgi:FMN phosphatase YigB (HAD superfamily)
MMTFTLLLDLDDTLLDSNMDTFIPAYFQALSGALADKVAPEVMLPALMGGTKRMMVNTDPALTLREVFDAYFFPKLNARRADLQPAIEKFYDEVFPTLSHLTRPRPGAVDLVKWAIAHGHRLVIATNPLFPLKAVHHRLRWAGLFPEKYHFALVTSYENCHFTKENLAYFPEIMGQLGWPADPLVMAGNDPDMDLRPAQRAGFPVFWVKKVKETASEHPDLPQGTLEEFRPWLESTDPKSLQPAFTAPEAMLALLRSTPAALATLTRDLPPDGYLCQPKPDEWCLTEILCHLRDVEREVSLPRIQKVLAEENPFIAGEDTDRWARERRYAGQDGRAALAEFTAARKETLSLLAGLASEWSRPARHAFFGPVTLQELMGFVAEHDRLHLQQVGKTI